MAADYEVSRLERGKRIMDNPEKTGDIPASPIVERNVATLNARVLVLESLNKGLIAERDAAVNQLKQANDLIEADTKARLVEQALNQTEMTLNELAGKDIDELENILTISALAKKQRFESGADLAAKPGKDKIDPNTYLHSLYQGRSRRN